MTNKQNPKFQELVAKLREIFQIDRPELDFGIYRILNARAGEINDYLQNRLAEKVQAALSAGSAASAQQLQTDLDEAIKQAQALGANPDDLPKVKDLRARLKDATEGSSEHENAVFSHLLAFFSRYYEQGDFISQRRYKGDTYAIPYSGEEVMLHWANKDQYYTKSGENFSNYSFKLEDGRTVHFRLAAADTAKDNRKDNDKERRFALVAAKTVTRLDENGDEYEEELVPVEEATGKDGQQELIIRFEYAAQPKGTKQEALVTKAVEAVLSDAAVKARWLALANRAPTEKNPQRTLLEKHLTDYTTKNTADYFIHKDLGGFLRRELDFYVKNEVMHLDDVQNAGAFADIEKNLRMIQCLRSIALELITFLAQLEDFQKKLWLKKKFVVSSHYCITLDRVPEALWPEVVANEQQWEQWEQLGLLRDGVDLVNTAKPKTIEYLKQNQFLTLDTSLFSHDFKSRLQSVMHGADIEPVGLLVHGENFQGLRLLRSRYCEQIKCVMTDPPYNTKSRDFHYKDNFKHSSWVAMMFDRAMAAKQLLSDDGVFFHHIDENEHQNASALLSEIFGEGNRVVDIAWKNSSKNGESYVAMQHEYIIGAVKNSSSNKGNWKERKEGLEEIYKAFDGFKKKYKTNWKAIHQAALDFYNSFPDSNPIKDNSHYSWMDEKGVYFPDNISKPANGYFYDIPHPKTGLPCKKPAGGWRFIESTMLEKIKNNDIHFGDDHTTVPNNKTYLKNTEEQSLTSIKYRDGRVASNLLKNMFGEKDPFKNPKDVDLTVRILKALEVKNGVILDYFGGSGTTIHAALELQRSETPVQYISIEIGDYFNTVLIPRVRKAIYSRDWKEGKPTAPETGISHCFKVLKLESYEDTLNNLQLRRTAVQGELLNTLPQQAKDDYLLNYLLDVESRGSLLSVEDFRKPFDYTLNVAVDSAGAFEPRKIDLVETFNYLIGLRVKHIDSNMKEGYVRVEGALPSGESALVIWRDCEKIDYETLKRYGNRFDLEGENNPFDVIYINGDHNMPAIYAPTEGEDGQAWARKIRQIEPEFLERMFSVEDI